MENTSLYYTYINKITLTIIRIFARKKFLKKMLSCCDRRVLVNLSRNARLLLPMIIIILKNYSRDDDD